MVDSLSDLDKFLLNSQLLVQSGNFPIFFREANWENQEPNEVGSENDPHPQVEISEDCSSCTVILTLRF